MTKEESWNVNPLPLNFECGCYEWFNGMHSCACLEARSGCYRICQGLIRSQRRRKGADRVLEGYSNSNGRASEEAGPPEVGRLTETVTKTRCVGWSASNCAGNNITTYQGSLNLLWPSKIFSLSWSRCITDPLRLCRITGGGGGGGFCFVFFFFV